MTKEELKAKLEARKSEVLSKLREEAELKRLEKELAFMESDLGVRILKKEANDNRLDTLRDIVADITGKPVWNEFSYPKSGKFLGLMRTVMFSTTHRDEILTTLGLSNSTVNEFREVYGNPAYIKDDTKVEEIPMKINSVKILGERIASTLGVEIDFSDLTPTHVKAVFKRRDDEVNESLSTLQRNTEIAYDE